jgi:hypothetical protein
MQNTKLLQVLTIQEAAIGNNNTNVSQNCPERLQDVDTMHVEKYVEL